MPRNTGTIKVFANPYDQAVGVRVVVRIRGQGINKAIVGTSRFWYTFDGLPFGSYTVSATPSGNFPQYNAGLVNVSISQTSFQANQLVNLTASGSAPQVPYVAPEPTPAPVTQPTTPPSIFGDIFGGGDAVTQPTTPTPELTIERWVLEVQLIPFTTKFVAGASSMVFAVINRLYSSSKFQKSGWTVGTSNISGDTLYLGFNKRGSISVPALVAIVLGVLIGLGALFYGYKFYQLGTTAQIIEDTANLTEAALDALRDGVITQAQFDAIVGNINSASQAALGQQEGWMGQLGGILEQATPLVLIGGGLLLASSLLKK